MFLDSIGKNAVKLLKDSLYGSGNVYESDYINGIWDIDEIPRGKRTALIKFYDGLLSKDELIQAPKGKNKLFCDGDTVLSCCIYSLYENVIAIIENYRGIDVMIDSYAPVDDSGKTFLEDKKIPLHEVLKGFGDIDIGMINPPYSLRKCK